jgi:hypothetical protein
MTPRPFFAALVVPALVQLYNAGNITSRPGMDPSQALVPVRLYDEVPEGLRGPYVALGEPFEEPADNHSTYGAEILQPLSVWSMYRGFAEIRYITDKVITALDHRDAELAALLPDFTDVSIMLRRTRMLRDVDPAWRQGIIDIVIRASRPITE